MNDEIEKHTDKTPGKPRRKINGLLIIGLILLFVVISTYQAEVHKIYCDDEVLATNPEVIMLGAWWCPYCYKARAYLQKTDISYCEYDIEHSETGKKLYDDTGITGIPVLIIGEHTLQGFDEGSIDRALELSREFKNN